jgi:hypothetical protein
MNRTIPALIVAALSAGASSAAAHHSIAAVYDTSQRMTLTGTVTDYQFVNPHPFFTIEVTDAAGRAETWRLEMDNRWELAELGFRANTFTAGDRIVVTGSLARKEPRSLYVRSLERPADGFRYRHHD